MKVIRRTPRTNLTFRALVMRMGTFYEQLASELGLEPLLVDEELTRFARLSVRVIFEEGESDFALAQMGDGPDTILSKFAAYLDTQCIEQVDQAFQAIRAHDNPTDPALAPTPLPESAEKN